MKNIKTYSEILRNIKESNFIIEKALDPIKINNIKRLRDANDFSSILKDLQPTIDLIINLCKDIKYDEIEYSNKNGIIEIFYKIPITPLLIGLKSNIELSGDEIDDKIFGNGWSDIFLKIDIDFDLLNKI